MSTFNIYQKREYAIMLSDSLAHRTAPGGDIAPLLAPKLVRVAPCIYAAHAGNWQTALKMLHAVHDYAIHSGPNSTYDEFIRALSQIGKEVYAEYRQLFKDENLDVRVPLVVTGKYRHPADIESDSATSMLIWESASNFDPRRTYTRASWAVNPQTTSVMVAIMQLPQLDHLLNTGPLSAAQALDAIHALVSKITTHVSIDTNILLVGKKEEHTLLKGHMLVLPNRAATIG